MQGVRGRGTSARLKLLVEDTVLTVLSVYVPQTGLEESTKDEFFDCLHTVMSKLTDKEIGSHIAREAVGYKGVHGGYGYGQRNADGDRILDFTVANDFVIRNNFFDKRKK